MADSYSTTYVVRLRVADIATSHGPEALRLRIGDSVTVVCGTAPNETERMVEQAAALRKLAGRASALAEELDRRAAGDYSGAPVEPTRRVA